MAHTTADYLGWLAQMKMDDKCRKALTRQLEAGNESARFVVYAWARKRGLV